MQLPARPNFTKKGFQLWDHSIEDVDRKKADR